MKSLIFLFCISVSAQPSLWTTGNYEIKGYSKKSKSSNGFVEINAPMAKGFSFGEFEEVEKPIVTITSSVGTLIFSGNRGLAKDDEIILEGKVILELNAQGKKILSLKAEVLYVQIIDLSLRSPSANVWLKGKNHKSLSVQIDLQNRKLKAPGKKLEISF